MRGLWRITRPLYAATATTTASSSSALSSSTAVALTRSTSNLGARRFIGFTATRYQPLTSNASTTTTIPTASVAAAQQAANVADAASAAAPTDPSATAAEEIDTSPPVDLKDVGAETSKVLTIADVLSRREEDLSQQGSAAPHFDEWESIPATHTVQDAIDMMVECNIGSLIVTEENAGIVGIVTERDILKKTSPRALVADQEKHVKEIMSAQIMCIPSTTTVIDALATMTKENIRHLAVINGEINAAVMKGSVPEEAMRCVLSIKDIVKAYAVFEEQKKKALEQQQPATATTTEPAVVTVETSTSPTPTPATLPATGSGSVDGEPPAATTTEDPAATATTAPAPPAAPVVTAATLLKKKHKKIKLILNTRVEDNILVAEAVEEMAKNNFGSVLVVDKDQRVLGIFTERDYLTKVLYPKQDPTTVKVTDVCTKKLSCLQIEDTLEKCWTQAAVLNFRHFPVIGTMRKDREKELAGVLSIKDIVREISKGHETPSGFRLMEFFKSKMAKDEPVAAPPPPPQPPVVAPTAAAVGGEGSPVVAAEETKPASQDSSPAQPEQGVASDSPAKMN